MTRQSSSTPTGYGGNADFWCRTVGAGLDRLRVELTDLAVLESLGELDGLSVLDAGCGEGYLSRILARRNARVTGIDLDEELVVAARRRAESADLDIPVSQQSVYELTFDDASFDRVVLNHVVNDLEHLRPAASEVGRVLKPGGKATVLMLHPAFYWQRRGLEDGDPGWPDIYWTQVSRQQTFSVAGVDSPGSVQAWYRSLEEVIGSFIDAGFVISGLTEPRPTARMMSDPWWAKRWTRPMFLLLTLTATTAPDY
ncbi:MAG: class I SAM-dependent methyltransferase [Actinomycetota bacterium]